MKTVTAKTKTNTKGKNTIHKTSKKNTRRGEGYEDCDGKNKNKCQRKEHH